MLPHAHCALHVCGHAHCAMHAVPYTLCHARFAMHTVVTYYTTPPTVFVKIFILLAQIVAKVLDCQI